MRAALVSLAGQPRDAHGQPLHVGGKALAQRQAEFALAAGCERVVALGDGSSAEAVALAHHVERSGARFQAIRDSHGLLGVVRSNDTLLVLAPGLLAESRAVLERLAAPAVLVAPADAVAAGFERIDLEHAWGGALVMPGQLVESLAELSPESEPAAALLRIALQARVKQVPLPDGVLPDGSWSVVRAADRATAERLWLARNLPPGNSWSWSERASRAFVKAFELHRRVPEGGLAGLAAGAVFLLVAAAALSLARHATLGLAVLALGALLTAGADVLDGLRAAPFGKRRVTAARWMPLLLDVALVACCAGAIPGGWPDRLFAPLVLVGLLRVARWPSRAPATALVGDRALLAVLLAVAAALGLAKPAIMLLALALLALKLAESRTTSR